MDPWCIEESMWARVPLYKNDVEKLMRELLSNFPFVSNVKLADHNGSKEFLDYVEETNDHYNEVWPVRFLRLLS